MKIGTITGGIPSSDSRLSLLQKLSYGVGHVLNDLFATMWFSYVIVYFRGVLEFSADETGFVVVAGQLFDGFCTVLVGILIDVENKIAVCARYGKRKTWHLIGTFFVAAFLPFVFSPCIGCQDADYRIQILYYCFFAALLHFGYACIQISHLALIPELARKKQTKTELTAIRYGFTVLSNVGFYTAAFFFVKFGSKPSVFGLCNDIDNSTSTTNFSCGNTTENTFDESTSYLGDGSTISPDDANIFKNIYLFVIIKGLFFSLIYHCGIKEPVSEVSKTSSEVEVSKNGEDPSTVNCRFDMRMSDWLKKIAFYEVSILYMLSRLFVNLLQVYIPMYVQFTLKLNKTRIATVPFAMYLASLAGSLIMKQVNKKIGRKRTFLLGCAVGLAGSVAVAVDSKSDSFLSWGVYCVAALFGFGGCTLLVTCLSMTADLIGNSTRGGFVYGLVSLLDKSSTGISIMIIEDSFKNATDSSSFYKHVIAYVSGSSCVLGIIVIVALLPFKIELPRGEPKIVKSIVEDPVENISVVKFSDLYSLFDSSSVDPVEAWKYTNSTKL